MSPWTQDERPYQLETPLGPNVLCLARFTGEERVSTLFHFVVEAWSERPDIQAKDLLLQPVTLSLLLGSGERRTIRGIVSRFGRGGEAPVGVTAYRLEIVPKAWLLTLDRDFDVYQERSVRDIVDDLLAEVPATWQTQRAFDPRPYCFRYRESRWQCATRLLEQEGVWYRFDHGVPGAKAVLADAPAAAQPQWGLTAMTWSERDDEGAERLHSLRLDATPYVAKSHVRTYSEFLVTSDLVDTVQAGGAWTPPASLRDYTFDQQLAADRSGITPGGGERADQPPKLAGDVSVQARLRQEYAEARALAVSGTSSYGGLECGAKVDVREHEVASVNGSYFVVAVRHEGSNGAYYAGDPATVSYRNHFTLLPHALPFRPPRTTPWPHVGGTHVGIVVGPAGEEIFTDKYGRVQVAFRWDQDHRPSLERSAWIRVAQPWAGPRYGAVFIPRVGHEVLVGFLDGNPDNPVVVGSLYNNANLPPWELPPNKTQSGVRTHSTLQGGADEFNELRFEDKRREELIYVQAQKDLDTLVKNDETRTVRHDRTTVIQRHDHETVKEGDDTTIVEKGIQLIEVQDNDRRLTVARNQARMIGEDETHSVGGDRTLDVGGDQAVAIGGDLSIEVEKGRVVTVKKDDTLELAEGSLSIDVKLGAITIKAMQSITLKVGTNTLTVDTTGVTISGGMVKVEGMSMAQLKSPMTQVNGDGMLVLKGGLTMIN